MAILQGTICGYSTAITWAVRLGTKSMLLTAGIWEKLSASIILGDTSVGRVTGPADSVRPCRNAPFPNSGSRCGKWSNRGTVRVAPAVSQTVDHRAGQTLSFLRPKRREVEPMAGIEPATDGLRNRCSTAELHWRPANDRHKKPDGPCAVKFNLAAQGRTHQIFGKNTARHDWVGTFSGFSMPSRWPKY